MKKIIFSLAVFLFSSYGIFAAGLDTQNYNYINDLVGDRALGMGGAYTAISDDPSGAYYNPAGIVFAIDNQISLSVNSYKNKRIEMEETLSTADGSKSYDQRIETLYPSFFGVVQALGKMKFAFSAMSINNEKLDQDEKFSNVYLLGDDGNIYSGTYYLNYNVIDYTYQLGPSLAMFITDSFTVGVSAYYFFKRKEIISNQILTFNKPTETSYQIINQYVTEEAQGVHLIFGLQYMPNKKLAFGFSLDYGALLSHTQNGQLFYKNESASGDLNSGGSGIDKSIDSEDVEKSDLPLVYRLGVAYFVSNKLVFSFDLIAHVGTKYYQDEVGETYELIGGIYDFNATYNFAIGAEFFVQDYFPVRAGFFTNFANTPEISENKTNQQMHVDLYGFSTSVSWQTKNSAITLGGFYQFGTGKAQIINNSKDTQTTNIDFFTFALTGTAKY